jgi:hypothetical protein
MDGRGPEGLAFAAPSIDCGGMIGGKGKTNA